ncbi:MAG: cell wall-binding repeat-containing protein, partial [Oscillospiraceae bacterium]|nr:cell wall-binding repeat-containing protein [Oscillospiraceae bacterium]
MKKIVRGLAAFIALLTIMTAFGMTGHHAFAAGAPTYIPPASVTTLSADFVRLFGEDRYKTNIAVCEECYQTSEFAVLASGRDFADALSGTPLAYMLEAPVLLTRGEAERLEPDVLAQLARLETKTVYILGGTAAISGGIENHLESSGYNVTRLFGEDRYATAVEVAKEMDDKRGEAAGAFVMADGRNFPDALAITPVAALKGWPILFTPGDVEGLNKNSETYFVDKGIEDAIIVGGTGVVPDSAEARITALGVSAERVYGEDRYWTAAAIATRFKDDFTGTGVGVATGLAFPDALSGSGLAAKYSIPLILLNGKGVVSVPAKNALLNTGASTVYAFGGEAVLGNNVLRAHGVPLQSISLAFSQKYYYVDQGKTLNIAINVGSTGYTVSYSSDGPGAPVSSAGVVTGNTAGLYRITATCDGVSATADVAVLAPKKDGVPQYTVSNDGLQFII